MCNKEGGKRGKERSEWDWTRIVGDKIWLHQGHEYSVIWTVFYLIIKNRIKQLLNQLLVYKLNNISKQYKQYLVLGMKNQCFVS